MAKHELTNEDATSIVQACVQILNVVDKAGFQVVAPVVESPGYYFERYKRRHRSGKTTAETETDPCLQAFGYDGFDET